MNHMYKEMVMYWSADYSGSMFTNLPDDIKVFAVTSAAEDETAGLAYCPPNNDIVNGNNIGACLATEFGTAWMQESFVEDTSVLTVASQAMSTRQTVASSTVQYFGDQTITVQPVGDFQGIDDGEAT